MENNLIEAINYRRSVRVYDSQKEIDSEVVKKCIQQATLAPTNSNMQLWEFHHITSKDILQKLAIACLNQNAATTAKQMVVIVVRKDLWKIRATQNIDFFNSTKKNLSDRNYDLTQKYHD